MTLCLHVFSGVTFPNDLKSPSNKRKRRFGRLRLRKRKAAEPCNDKEDTISLCSISSLASISSVSSVRSSKSKTPLSKVTAHFAHLVASSPPIRALKRTFESDSSNPSKKPYKSYRSPEVKYKPRETKYWIDTVENVDDFSKSDIKRQEVLLSTSVNCIAIIIVYITAKHALWVTVKVWTCTYLPSFTK